ncbi:zinc finger protein 70-like isoform X22 [Diorhabda carinulata]|uniref:zinc finger protein 70-like isoform X22 n=1 Tax=Diorhabda carinulata TaxID=1163345 RepID=UPI0025A0FBFD|nr:zinc finger protein 70-like isoform X22 [Diorhabda carinulata]
MDNNNMLKLCRLCLVKDDVNIPIFEEQGDIRQIFLKISSCLPVKVSRDDQLPKKICDGCSYKLDMLYEFWNTSANAEKQLLTWLGEAGMSSQMADGTISAVAQQIKPADAFVKQETIDPPDIHMDDDDDDDEEDKDYMKQEDNSNNVEEPPPKRARRTAAVKAAIALDQNSDDDDDSGEPMTKVEDDSEDSDNEDHEPAFVDVPSTSADDQPGPSGVGKDGVEAPLDEKPLIDYSAIMHCQVDYQGFTCEICQKNFASISNLRRHRITHQEKTFACDMCPKVFHQKYNLEYHKNFKHFRKFTCKCYYCDQVCLNKNGLKLHIDNVHLNKYKFGCEKCPKGYNSKSELEKHIKFDHEGLRYNCLVCEKHFKDNNHFKQHIKTHDPNYTKPEFTCLVCGKILSMKSHDRHMKMHQGNVGNNVVCDICGVVVSSKSHLINHRRTHTGEKPYKCDFCEKRFARSETLADHRRVHTKERPYVCSVCCKGFTQKSALNVHMRIHTGEKPHFCHVCQKKFTTKHLLRNHKCIGPHVDEDINDDKAKTIVTVTRLSSLF